MKKFFVDLFTKNIGLKFLALLVSALTVILLNL